jgi:RNA polymerase sigma factor (TIGR02999 family)
MKAHHELMPLVYDELRRIAARYMGRERPGQTLQATGLVNEAFVRMAAERTREFQNRTHFLAIAALSMRQILVQRARAKRASKRDAGGHQVTLNDISAPPSAIRPEFERADSDRPGDVDVLALDEALVAPSGRSTPRRRRSSSCATFGGLTVEETAEAVGVSPATVKRQWAMARAWLKQALEGAWTAAALEPDQSRLQWRARTAARGARGVAAPGMRQRRERCSPTPSGSCVSFDTLGGFLDQPARVAPEDVAQAMLPEAGIEGAGWRPGDRVGEFEIVRAIGRGGMGVVYLATDRRLHRNVALKSLPASLAGNPELRERL